MSDEEPTLLAMDAEANDEIVYRRRCDTAQGATAEPCDAGPQIDRFPLAFLRLAHVMVLGGDRSRVHAPSLGGETDDATRLQALLQVEKHCILPSPTDVCYHGTTVRSNSMPSPPRLRLLAHITPQRIAL